MNELKAFRVYPRSHLLSLTLSRFEDEACRGAFLSESCPGSTLFSTGNPYHAVSPYPVPKYLARFVETLTGHVLDAHRKIGGMQLELQDVFGGEDVRRGMVELVRCLFTYASKATGQAYHECVSQAFLSRARTPNPGRACITGGVSKMRSVYMSHESRGRGSLGDVQRVLD